MDGVGPGPPVFYFKFLILFKIHFCFKRRSNMHKTCFFFRKRGKLKNFQMKIKSKEKDSERGTCFRGLFLRDSRNETF